MMQMPLHGTVATAVSLTPVAQKRHNELSLYDMSGNVFEWCFDWLDCYSSNSQTNPTGPSSGNSRILRGGSCFYIAVILQVSTRFAYVPYSRYGDAGLRLAL